MENTKTTEIKVNPSQPADWTVVNNSHKRPSKTFRPPELTDGAIIKPSKTMGNYWNMLYRNLNRAVDEFYYQCEVEANLFQASEIALTLERMGQQFRDLIERLELIQQNNDNDKSALVFSVRPPTSIDDLPPFEPRTPPNQKHKIPHPTSAYASMVCGHSPEDKARKTAILESISRKGEESSEIIAKKIEYRQARADMNRARNINQRTADARMTSQKIKRAEVRKQDKIKSMKESLQEEHRQKGERYDAHIKERQQRASRENAKVEEHNWLISLEKKNLLLQQQKKLEDGEARRQDHLKAISESARHHSRSKSDLASSDDQRISYRDALVSMKAPIEQSPIPVASKVKSSPIASSNVSTIISNKPPSHVGASNRGKTPERKQSFARSTSWADFSSDDSDEELSPLVINSPEAKPAAAQPAEKIIVEKQEKDNEANSNKSLKKKLKKLRQSFRKSADSSLLTIALLHMASFDAKLKQFTEQLDSEKIRWQVISKIIETDISKYQDSARHHASIVVVEWLFSLLSLDSCTYSESILVLLLRLLNESPISCRYVLCSNQLYVIIDRLLLGLIPSATTSHLLQIATITLSHSTLKSSPSEIESTTLILRYIAICGLFNEIAAQFIQPLKSLSLVLHCVQFVEAFTAACSPSTTPLPVYNTLPDFAIDSQDINESVISILRSTNMAGIISLMTTITLEHSEDMPVLVAQIVTSALTALNNVGRVHLTLLQEFARSGSFETELYHSLSFLLSCGSKQFDSTRLFRTLLHQLLLFIGYYALLNPANQDTFHWGQPPTLLQKLCNLPFSFFLDDKGKVALFPTLIAITYDNPSNKSIMAEDFNSEHIVSFLLEQKKLGPAKDLAPTLQMFECNHRFPPALWDKAIEFFSF